MTLSAVWLNSAAAFSTTSIGVSVTATGTAGRMIVFVVTDPAGGGTTPVTVTGVAGLSVTWHHRSDQTYTTSLGLRIEEWYADVLSSWTTGTITATISGVFDGAIIMATLVTSSTNSVISFDTSTTVPATFNSNVSHTATVSVNARAPLVLAAAASCNQTSAPGATPASINTLLGSQSETSSPLNNYYGYLYGAAPGPMSGATVGFSALANPGVGIVDALAEPPPGPGNMIGLMGR